MINDETIWIGENGERRGPFSDVQVVQWMSEGKFGPDTLGWREGMPAWALLTALFPSVAIASPPTLPPLGVTPASSTPKPETWAAPAYPSGERHAQARAALPTPPSLHWLLLILFSVFTLGIFAAVWSFVQASWVRRIDAKSNALWTLVISVGSTVAAEVIVPITNSTGSTLTPLNASLSAIIMLLLLLCLVLYYVAFFSMAASMRERMQRDGLTPDINGVTVFFFTGIYLQGQMSWLARWKRTGQTSPQPPQGVLYLLWLLLPIVMGILAAIAIPAYQNYLVRTQTNEAFVIAHQLEPSLKRYFQQHNGTLPADNSTAGLGTPTSFAGKYVASVGVYNGSITVAFRDTANPGIRDEDIVLAPEVQNGQLTWVCSSQTTVSAMYLPASCKAP